MKYLLVLVLLLVGCTQTVTPTTGQSAQPSLSAPSTESPNPTPTCSPMGGTPRPCSADEYQKVEEQNRLIRQAEVIYEEYWKENVRLQKAGGVASPTPVLKRVLEQPALEQAMKVYRNLKKNRARAVGGVWKVFRIVPQPTRTMAGSLIAMEVCWQVKGVTFISPGESLPGGATVIEMNYFRLYDSDLKIFQATSRKVSRC